MRITWRVGKKLAELKKKMDQRREEQQELAEKSLDELVVEFVKGMEEVAQLYNSKKDWKEVEPEIAKILKYSDRLEVEFKKRPKLESLSKQEAVFQAGLRMAQAEENRNIRESEKIFKKNIEDWDDVESLKKKARDKNFSLEEYIQVRILNSLERMIFGNSRSSAELRKRIFANKIFIVQMQAGMTNILEKVEKNTSKKEQIRLIVIGSFFGGALVLFLGKLLDFGVELLKMAMGSGG